MKYPTLKEVDAANLLQLGTWHRFLPHPGTNVSEEDRGTAKYDRIVDFELRVMRAIIDRFVSLGGWNAELSQEVGFEAPVNDTSTPQ